MTSSQRLSFSSYPMLMVLCFINAACLLFYFSLGRQPGVAASCWLLCESCIFIQLIFAWHQQWGKLRYPVVYILCGLFFFRVIYFFSDTSASSWYLRSQSTLPPLLIMAFYLIGILGLHPLVMRFLFCLSKKVAMFSGTARMSMLTVWFILLTVCFWLFRSVHITRDGFDWIERTMQPVWHLYMREPLTIALYRWVYLTANQWITLSSHQAIAVITILTSILGLVCYHLFLRSLSKDEHHILLGWLWLFSVGGLSVLFFGHIEVYPILCGFLFVVFLCMQKYMNGTWSILPVALSYSFAFAAHLSSGWLLPAMLFLPFNSSNKQKIRDWLMFTGIFTATQSFFWGTLIIWKYDSNFVFFLARLHQTFNVGLDRAMFISPSLWFSTEHLQDWVSVYGYLMPGGMILLPIISCLCFSMNNRKLWIWLTAFAGYFLYTFCWNADRGYPEDWDLFSPITVISIPLILTLFFERKHDDNECDPYTVCLYLVSMGFIPFTLAQIWFHHTQRFISLLNLN